MNKVLFSHKSDHWKTPKAIYHFFFDYLHCVDPCPYLSKDDNLKKDFKGVDLFINPPYSNIDAWVDFAIHNFGYGNRIFLLLPVRSDTKWFEKLFSFGCYICFIIGRLHFNDEKNSAPFPSMIVKLKGSRSSSVHIIKNNYFK